MKLFIPLYMEIDLKRYTSTLNLYWNMIIGLQNEGHGSNVLIRPKELI